MSQPLETAYVEIVPDFSGFAREVRTGIRAEMARLEIEIRDAARGMERAISNAARDAGTALARNIGVGAELAKLAINDVGDEAGVMSRKIRRSARDARQDLERLAARGFLRTLADGFGEVGRVVGQLFAQIGRIPPLLLLIIGLTPPIIGLASALADLVGIIGVVPAGVAVLLATIIPAIVAFQNFGTAVELLAQGTPKTKAELEKLNEALGKLAPSARTVARELAGLTPLLKDIQVQTQQAFFQPLQGVFPQLAATLSGPIKDGMTQVASALGDVVAQIIRFFSLAENATVIRNLFKTTADIIRVFGPNAVKFFEAMGEAINAALPFVKRISDALSDALGRFADFIVESVRNGDFQKFVEDAFTTFKELGALLGATLRLIGTLFGATNKEGHDLIVSLTDMIIKLDDFLNSAEGQKTLQELIFLIKLFASSLEIVLGLFIVSQQTFSQFIEFLQAIGTAVTNFALINLGTLVRAAAVAFAWIPGLGPKLQKASDEFDAWAKGILKQINDLNGKTITITVKTIANAVAAGALGGIGPHLAGGGLALGPSTIAEAGRPELALPLSDPRAQRAIRQAIGELDAGGTVINFGAGAISVSFEGVVPTVEEARGVGTAVGEGILSRLAAQSVRAALRAV